MYCRQCGKEVKTPAQFCAGCGAPIGKTITAPRKAFRIRPKVLVGLGALAGIAILVVGGTIFIDKWQEWKANARAASLFNEASQLVDQADKAHECSFSERIWAVGRGSIALSELGMTGVKDHSAYLDAFRDYNAAIAKAHRIIKDYPSTSSAKKFTQTGGRMGAHTLSELEAKIIPRMEHFAWTIAAGRGDIDIVRGLLKKGMDPNVRENGADGYHKGFTALHAAAAGGSVEIVKYLLKSGADPNVIGETTFDGGGEYTPLTEAAVGGHAEIVKLLLEAGADPRSKASNTYCLTALGHALQGGHRDIVEMLLAAGSNLTYASSDFYTPERGGSGDCVPTATFLAVVEGGFTDIVERLLKAGAHPDSCQAYNCALQNAAERGHTEILKLLVNAGANLDIASAYDGPEYTALGLALQHRHADIVALLKKSGAKVISRETTTTDNINYVTKSTTIDDPKGVSVLLEKVQEKGVEAHHSLRQLLDRFRQNVGRYPTTDEGLQALTERPSNIDPCKWNGPYLPFDEEKQDPWVREYHYISPGKHGEYDLFSLGADNAEGGGGENKDIVSWSETTRSFKITLSLRNQRKSLRPPAIA